MLSPRGSVVCCSPKVCWASLHARHSNDVLITLWPCVQCSPHDGRVGMVQTTDRRANGTRAHSDGGPNSHSLGYALSPFSRAVDQVARQRFTASPCGRIGHPVGLFVPVVSAIFPIRHALGQNLHDSLDTKRQKGTHATIEVISEAKSALLIPAWHDMHHTQQCKQFLWIWSVPRTRASRGR
jgi:hypothetical protein